MSIQELFNNPENQFTREELIELGLVKDDDTPPREEPPREENDQAARGQEPSPAPQTDKLAEVIDKLTQFVDARTQQAAPQPQEEPREEPPNIEELLEQGDVGGALEAVKTATQQQINAITAQQAALLSSYAKELFRQRLGDDEYNRWWPLMEKQMAAAGVNPAQFVTVDQLDQALKITKAENLELVLQQEREKWAQETRQQVIGGGSVGEPSILPKDVDIDPVAFSTARDLGLSAKEWAKNRKIIDKCNTSADPNMITDVPLIDDDFTSRDEFGDIKIEPGRF